MSSPLSQGCLLGHFIRWFYSSQKQIEAKTTFLIFSFLSSKLEIQTCYNKRSRTCFNLMRTFNLVRALPAMDAISSYTDTRDKHTAILQHFQLHLSYSTPYSLFYIVMICALTILPYLLYYYSLCLPSAWHSVLQSLVPLNVCRTGENQHTLIYKLHHLPYQMLTVYDHTYSS